MIDKPTTKKPWAAAQNGALSKYFEPHRRAFSAVAIVAAAGLSACNQVTVPDLISTGSVFGAAQAPAFQHTIAEKRRAQDAFLRLPDGAGQILGVTQKRYGNGAEQLIVYRGDNHTRGENAARVKLVSNASQFGRRPENLSIDSTTDRKINAEIKQVLPGVAMAVSNQLHSNSYGPFGYALGRAGSRVQCIYGWQNMSGTETDRWAPLRGKSAKPELSVRLRVCRADTSAERLVDLMRNLRIEADPEQVLKPQPVAWSAGSGADLSMAMPNYDPGGYMSQPDLIAPESVVEQKSPPVNRAKAKRHSVKRTVTRDRKIDAPVRTVSQKIYSPPLPTPDTVSRGPSLSAPLVQPRKSAPLPAPVLAPLAKTPRLVTARKSEMPSPTPVSFTAPALVPSATRVISTRRVDPIKTATSLPAVPLPN